MDYNELRYLSGLGGTRSLNVEETIDRMVKEATARQLAMRETTRPLLAELASHSRQPVKSAMLTESVSTPDRDMLMKLLSEAVRYAGDKAVMGQITTKLVDLMEKYNVISVPSLVRLFGGKIIMEPAGNTVIWN